MRVRVTQRAIDDLTAIVEWIEMSADPVTADTYLGRIYSQIATLADFPNRHPRRPDLLSDARAISFEGRLLIVYVVKEDLVEVLRVVSTARDLSSSLHS